MIISMIEFQFDETNTFCISLFTHETRWKRMKQRLEHAGLHRVARSPAAIGGTSDVVDHFASYLNDGQKGCSQSHINLWRRMVQEQLPYAFILEDDACFDKDWRAKLNAFFSDIYDPNWELILLNASEPCEPMYTWVQAREQYLTAGYILSIRGAKRLLEMFAQEYYASDWMTSRLQLHGHSYCYFPWPIIQEGNDSTIGGGYREDHAKVVTCLKQIDYSLDNYITCQSNYMIPDCTLTTCCFSTIRFNPYGRSIEDTLSSIAPLMEVPCYLVIYTEPMLYDSIKKIRDKHGLGRITHYVIMNVEELSTFAFREKVADNREKYHPTKDARTCVESHLICASKFDLVLKTIHTDPFHTTKFGWIDSHVGTRFSKIATNYTNHMLLNALQYSNPDKFHIQILNVCDKKYIQEEHLREYYQQYRWVVCGCLFVTGRAVGTTLLNALHEQFIKHTMLGYGHGEEMFYLEILEKYGPLIQKSYGDYQHILNNFTSPTVGFDYILNNIVKRYSNMGYHNECVDCCLMVIRAYEELNIELDYALYYSFLYYLYVSSFYTNTELCKKTLHKLHNIIQHPYIRPHYISNQVFYDSQFAYGCRL